MRVEGWELLLHEHLSGAAPFAWGSNDCALWSAAWVRKATGRDCAAEWAGRYTTENELRDLMRERGHRTTADIADATGFPSVHVAFARRGDIVLHPQRCLGICDGLHSHFLTKSGLTRLMTLACVKAWKVD
ncbi:DUF6950 family protein [Zavarzinella formosa]|uniref:DUF6950 family protein n=1 Tax=Zavarzinella formosa TaxID=360055 RepID=UPI00030B00B2|nr:hypothetical protein [Zavarzinella formosa]